MFVKYSFRIFTKYAFGVIIILEVSGLAVLTVTLNPCIDKTITVERFKYGGLNRAERVSSALAGKGINVSRVLEASGIEQTATGFMGDCFEKTDINARFVRAAGSVRTNIKLFDAESHITTEINEKGFEVSEDKLSEFEILYGELLNSCRIAVISGSMPKGVPSGFYARLISAAHEKHIKTILDCSGEPFALGLEAIPYAVKPNICELEEYFGEELDSDDKIISAAQRLCAIGIRLAAVSMGSGGAVFCSGGEVIRVKPFEADIKSTVGAGDSMVAAIAYCINSGFDLYHTATLATAMGTLTATLEGTAFTSIAEAEKMRSRLICDIL